MNRYMSGRQIHNNPSTFVSQVRRLRYLLILMSALSASACVSSPVLAVAQRTVDAAEKGRLKRFQKQFSPAAQSTLATQQQMDAMHQKLALYTNISAEQALIVSSQEGDQDYGHFGTVLETYDVPILGSPAKKAPPELIYTLALQCAFIYKKFHHDETSESCTTTIDENNIPWTNCTPGTPAYDSIDLTEKCKVTGVDEPQVKPLSRDVIN
jgi:hypothetical protein